MRKILLLIKTAYISLLLHKVRSFLSILGVICGVMAVMSMISIGEGAKNKVLQDIESLGLRNVYINQIDMTQRMKQEAVSMRSYGLSWYDVQRLRYNNEYIQQVGAIRELKASFYGSKMALTPKIVQSTANYLQILGVSLAEGRPLLPADEQESNHVCVIGADLAFQLGSSGQVGSTLRIGSALYRVVGILARRTILNSDSVKMSPDNFNETLFLPFAVQQESAQGSLSRVLVEIREGRSMTQAAGVIGRVMETAHNGVTDYQIVVPLELLNQSLQTQKIFNLVLAVIGGISLLVGGVGIMNIMLATVSERKHEIGLRRSLGATEKDIVAQFLTEAILLTLSGGIIGIILGGSAIGIIESLTGWPVKITLPAMLIPFNLSVCTGVFFGLYPAVKAARIDPIEALSKA